MSKLVFYNSKGGVGKSTLSMCIALETGFPVATNDLASQSTGILPEEKFKILAKEAPFPEIPSDLDIIYDLAGHNDDRIIPVLREADFVVIPIINDRKEIFGSLKTIETILEFTNNIVFIANKLEGNSGIDFDSIKKIISTRYNFPVFPLKKSTIFDQSEIEKKSISYVYNKALEKKMPYCKAFEKVVFQMKEIINYLLYNKK